MALTDKIRNGFTSLAATWLAVAAAWPVSVHAQGIYACTDAKGRRITSDRPILECMDRDQTELSSNGTVKRIIKPSMTADEREAHEEQLRKQQEEANRAQEERRRNRALVTRYPNKAAHDNERKEALLTVDIQVTTANARIAALEIDRKKLEEEMLFYKKDPSKAPFMLRKQSQDNVENLEKQRKVLAQQGTEAAKINARFDAELAKLRQLWAQAGRNENGETLKTK